MKNDPTISQPSSWWWGLLAEVQQPLGEPREHSGCSVSDSRFLPFPFPVGEFYCVGRRAGLSNCVGLCPVGRPQSSRGSTAGGAGRAWVVGASSLRWSVHSSPGYRQTRWFCFSIFLRGLSALILEEEEGLGIPFCPWFSIEKCELTLYVPKMFGSQSGSEFVAISCPLIVVYVLSILQLSQCILTYSG